MWDDCEIFNFLEWLVVVIAWEEFWSEFRIGRVDMA